MRVVESWLIEKQSKNEDIETNIELLTQNIEFGLKKVVFVQKLASKLLDELSNIFVFFVTANRNVSNEVKTHLNSFFFTFYICYMDFYILFHFYIFCSISTYFIQFQHVLSIPTYSINLYILFNFISHFNFYIFYLISTYVIYFVST